MNVLKQLSAIVIIWLGACATQAVAEVKLNKMPNGETVITKGDDGRSRYTRCENNWCTTSYSKIDVEPVNKPTNQGGGFPVVDLGAVDKIKQFNKR